MGKDGSSSSHNLGKGNMKILASIDRIPGGLMLVPLFLGAIVHTFAPGAGKHLGSFSNGLISLRFFTFRVTFALSFTRTIFFGFWHF